MSNHVIVFAPFVLFGFSAKGMFCCTQSSSRVLIREIDNTVDAFNFDSITFPKRIEKDVRNLFKCLSAVTNYFLQESREAILSDFEPKAADIVNSFCHKYMCWPRRSRNVNIAIQQQHAKKDRVHYVLCMDNNIQLKGDCPK